MATVSNPPLSPDLREKRGSDTRHALILAGLDLFGEYGSKGTTTRMLCETSGANVAAINYHFVNKEGLYLAVVEHISNHMQQHMRPTAEAAVAIAAEAGFTPAAARVAMTTIIDTLARLMVESDEEGATTTIATIGPASSLSEPAVRRPRASASTWSR